MIVVYGQTVEAYYIGSQLANAGHKVMLIQPPLYKTKYPKPVLFTEDMRKLFQAWEVPMELARLNEVYVSYLADDGVTLEAEGYGACLVSESELYTALRLQLEQLGGIVVYSPTVHFDVPQHFVYLGTSGYRYESVILTQIPPEEFFVNWLCTDVLYSYLCYKKHRPKLDTGPPMLFLGLGPQLLGYRAVCEDIKHWTLYGIRGTLEISEDAKKVFFQNLNSRAKPLEEWDEIVALGNRDQASKFHAVYPEFMCCGFSSGMINPVTLGSGFGLGLQWNAIKTGSQDGLSSRKTILAGLKNEYTSKILTTTLGKPVLERFYKAMTHGRYVR